MAFRLPPQVTRRRNSYSTQYVPEPDIPSPVSPLFENENESTQWVLFSPPQPSTARTHTTSTERTPRRTGASRLSDFGSFDTATRSIFGSEGDNTEGDAEEPLDEDGTELDSLDDGLHAFRAPSVTQESTSRLNQSTPAVLPTHDGLGSFHASSQPVQEQLWQYEQFNPRRRGDVRPRRRSSVQRQLDTVEDREQVDMEYDRWRRIEKWRMDQSRALLQEIERETRRRRRNSRVSVQPDQVTSRPIVPGTSDGALETPKEDSLQPHQESEEDESFWRRITRKVIRDLIGIDDSLLSVILGESLPDMGSEDNKSAGTDNSLDLSKTLGELDSMPDEQGLWQSKLLHRIARELGILVHHLCEHPGAFTTYLNVTNEIPNEYAGIPLGRLAEENEAASQGASAEPALHTAMSSQDSMMSPQFSPTMRDPTSREHAAHWGIEDEEDASREPLPESTRLQQEKDYWERELDVMMVSATFATASAGEVATRTAPMHAHVVTHRMRPDARQSSASTTPSSHGLIHALKPSSDVSLGPQALHPRCSVNTSTDPVQAARARQNSLLSPVGERSPVPAGITGTLAEASTARAPSHPLSRLAWGFGPMSDLFPVILPRGCVHRSYES